MNELGASLHDGMEELMCGLPHSPTAAVKWRTSKDRENMELPVLRLNSGGHSSASMNMIRKAHNVIHWQDHQGIKPGDNRPTYLNLPMIQKHCWAPFNAHQCEYWHFLCPNYTRSQSHNKACEIAKKCIVLQQDLAVLRRDVKHHGNNCVTTRKFMIQWQLCTRQFVQWKIVAEPIS
jgi:hypothetical protein